MSLCFFAGCAALSLRAADAPTPPAKEDRPERAEHGTPHRVFVHRTIGEKGEKENVAFLGVETSPVSPTLSTQLQLPKGAGLIVAHVVPDSAASGVLQAHDILLKLDDQLLIDSRQFSVLIRNHAEGDSVTLTYVRAGKQATATVKLVKREVPKSAFFRQLAPGDASLAPFAGREFGSREETDQVLGLVGPGPKIETRRFHGKPGPNTGFRVMKVNPGNSNMIFNDDHGTLELTIKDGQKSLVAKNEKGEKVYSGPATTPDERKALPVDVRERLERIEGMHEFSFETDDAFQDDVLTTAPEPHRVVLQIPTSSEDILRSSAL
ncbi:MAG: PDZ domain-containing protein [Opitutus sp.]